MVIVLCAIAACGKKGPPLAPFVPIPAAVEQIGAERVGSDVYVTLTVPAMNIDEVKPANLERIEVYGYTGRAAPPRGRWVELATLVATVPVTPPPAAGEKPDSAAEAPQQPKAPPQGSSVTLVDALTPEELVQGKLPVLEAGAQSREQAERTSTNVEAGPRNPEPEIPLRRFYMALPWNRRGRPGPPGAVAELPLLPVPAPPPAIDVTYNASSVMVSWEPSGGLIGFLFERPLPEEPPPIPDDETDSALETVDAAPPGPLQYNVYREIVPDILAPPPAGDETWQVTPPAPINPLPLATLEFTDPVEFDRQRCYTVRAIRGVGGNARVGDASPAMCVTPTDTFAPAAPRTLETVASEGAINLIWEPNAESDLGGYVVLRGDASDARLLPLTIAPITDARYRDEAVTPGTRYVYAVVAVDNRFPVPNMSAESNRVEETAR